MFLRVEFKEEDDGIRAVLVEAPTLEANGASKQEALAKLLPMVEAFYRARIGSVQFTLTDAPAPISNAQLEKLATKYPPPASWFEEEQNVL